MLLAFVLSTSSKAEIIDNGSYTTDTESGLDWLDVPITANKSYNTIFDQLGPGGEFDGFRYATAQEFNTLISHYTAVSRSQTQVRQVLDASTDPDNLMRMLGSTQTPVKRRRGFETDLRFEDEKWARMLDSVIGITIKKTSNNGYAFISYSLLAKTQDFGTQIWHYSIADINRYINRNIADPEVGSFLVRESQFSRSAR